MSHHLQDRFMYERFLLLALLDPVWELGNDGTEGRSKERGAAHVEKWVVWKTVMKQHLCHLHAM